MRFIYRQPGLAELTKTDAELVLDAKADLQHLLADPYYHEAFQRLVREKHEVVRRRRGILPSVIGKLALRLQVGVVTRSSRKAVGRPRKDSLGLAKVLKAKADFPGGISYADASRRLLRGLDPQATESVIERKAREFAQALRNEKKRAGKK